MTSFTFNTVPRIVSGQGEALKLAEHCRDLGLSSVLLVTDPGLVKLGLIDPARQALVTANIDVSLFSDVKEDPPESVVLAAVAQAERDEVAGVVAIGGGSSMDVAKVVSALIDSDQTLAEMYGVNQVAGGRRPLILVPTTAGTGSEVTPVSVITTGETTKAGVSSPVLLPDVAVLDADLTLGLPPVATAMTGVDAMVHAIEAFTSKIRKNPISDNLARSALVALNSHIRTAVSNGKDWEARSSMLIGAMQAGQAFANAPVAAVHALAYPLGGHYKVPHGLSNSLVLPAVLRFNLPDAVSLYAELAELLNQTQSTGSEEAKAMSLIESLEQLIVDLELPTSLRAVGVEEASLDMLAGEAMHQQRLLVNNPREVTLEDARAIYQAAF
ncbi:MAG: iron-containing alcohol dehydrogenase [Pseudomonadota bacterium]